jgi:hypothetical protein
VGRVSPVVNYRLFYIDVRRGSATETQKLATIKNNNKEEAFLFLHFFSSLYFFARPLCVLSERATHQILEMISKTENETFLTNDETKLSSQSNKCCSKWWNQGYRHQQFICEIIESFFFRALIIFLVVLDTSLVITEMILDSLKIDYECESHVHHKLREHNTMMKERIEYGMEIAHYGSIAILLFFVVELIIKIYAFGREFWNIRRRKMEYFDAFLVLTSLSIDLYFLRGEEKILGKRLLLILSFRLWRFLRIISSKS